MSGEQQPQQQERSLYRRHRPRSFAEVVGQEPVVRTLRNAVAQDRVHHAYLFVGSRGTGKTSMAKILAACLNCEQGPTVEPCGVCQSCVSIAAANSLDVIEMDAASNNSVEDIRDLRESVAFAPVSGRRKIYILDEAHMLSTAAWNAFLKTLEEPPPGTVFVLATTEANKVPATVVDRCHRFDFHRPTVEQIVTVLTRAAGAESISIPPAALAAVARSATGSFRDALGTLEQLVTYSGREIAVEDVLAVLGVADSRLLAQTVAAVAAGDAATAMRALAGCLEQGRDAASFAADLEVRARELLVVQTLGEVPDELSLTPESDAGLLEQAEAVEHAVVVRLLELLGEAMEAIRAGADPRTRLELALVKASRPALDGSLRALLSRIERLEQARATAPLPAAGVAEVAPAAASAPATVSAPAVTQPASAGPVASAGGTPAQPVEAGEAGVPEAAVAAQGAGGSGAPEANHGGQPGEQGAPLLQAQPPTAFEPEPEAASAAVAVAEPITLAAFEALWPAVIEVVRGEHSMLGALVADARPVELTAEELTLAFPLGAQFYKRKAEDPDHVATVQEALRAVTGTRLRLTYELRELGAHEGAGDGDSEASEERRVARFMEEFDAEEIEGDWDHEHAADASAAAPGALTSNEKGA